MARREDGDTAISLFSFQDIITSITGIMFLLVLMLVLSLLSSHLPDKTAAESAERARLADEVARLQAQADALKLNAQSSDIQLAKLRKLSAAELIRRSKELQVQLQKLHAELQTAEAELQRKLHKLNTAAADAEKLGASNKKLSDAIADQTSRLTELQQQQKELKKLLRQKKNLIKYTISQNSGKIPLLLELGSDGIQLLDTATMRKNDLRNSDPEKSCLNLQDILGDFDHNQYYFSLAVKPGGFAYANRVLTILKKAGFERGIEIIPDDKSSLFPEESL
jgi:hypothetical protein